MGTIIETNNLRAYYITKAYGVERTVKAVDDITLRIQEGEVYGIAGESGCGKSTLLRILLGANQPPLTVVGGEVIYHLDGEDMNAADMTEEQQRDLKWRTISYIPAGFHARAESGAADPRYLSRFHQRPSRCDQEGIFPTYGGIPA